MAQLPLGEIFFKVGDSVLSPNWNDASLNPLFFAALETIIHEVRHSQQYASLDW